MKNVICWFDLPSADFDRAVKFYSQVLGQEVVVTEFMGQNLGMFAQAEVSGCIVPPGLPLQPSSSGTRIYFNCDGMLDETIARVEPAGGKVLQPRFSIGEHGWIAIIQDTEGNQVGLWSQT